MSENIKNENGKAIDSEQSGLNIWFNNRTCNKCSFRSFKHFAVWVF